MTLFELYQEALKIDPKNAVATRVFFYEDFERKIKLLNEVPIEDSDLTQICQCLLILSRMFEGVDLITNFLDGHHVSGSTDLMRQGLVEKAGILLGLLVNCLVSMNEKQDMSLWSPEMGELGHASAIYLARYLWLVVVKPEDFNASLSFLMQEVSLTKARNQMMSIEDLLKVVAGLRRFLDAHPDVDYRRQVERLFVTLIEMPSHPDFIRQFTQWGQYNYLVFAASGFNFKFEEFKQPFFNRLVRINMQLCLYQMNKALDQSVKAFLDCTKALLSSEVVNFRSTHVQCLIYLHVIRLKKKQSPEMLRCFSAQDIKASVLELSPEALADTGVKALGHKLWAYFDESSPQCLPFSERMHLSMKITQLINEYGEIYSLWFRELFLVLARKEISDTFYLKMRGYQTLSENQVINAFWDKVCLLPTSKRFSEQDYIKAFLLETANAEEYLQVLHQHLVTTSDIHSSVQCIIDVLFITQSSMHLTQEFAGLMRTLNALIFSLVSDEGFFSSDAMPLLMAAFLLTPQTETINKELYQAFIKSILKHQCDPSSVFERYPNLAYFYQPLDLVDQLAMHSQYLLEDERLRTLQYLKGMHIEITWRRLLSELVIYQAVIANGFEPESDIFEPYLVLDERCLNVDPRTLVLTDRMVQNLQSVYQHDACKAQRPVLASLFNKLYVGSLLARWQIEEASTLSSEDLYRYIRISALKVSGFLFSEALIGLMRQKIKFSQIMTKDQMKRLKQLVPTPQMIECFEGGLLLGNAETLSGVMSKGKHLTSLPFYHPMSQDTLRYISDLAQGFSSEMPADDCEDMPVRWKIYQHMGYQMDCHKALPYKGLLAVQSILMQKQVSQNTLFAFKQLLSEYPSALYVLQQNGVDNDQLRLLLALYTATTLRMEDWHQYFQAQSVDAVAGELLEPLFKAKCPQGLKYWRAHPQWMSQSMVSAQHQTWLIPIFDHEQQLAINDVLMSKQMSHFWEVYGQNDWLKAGMKLDQLWHLHIVKHCADQSAAVRMMIQMLHLLSRLPRSLKPHIDRTISLQCDASGLKIFDKGCLIETASNLDECFNILAQLVARQSSQDHVILYALLMSTPGDMDVKINGLFDLSHPLCDLMALEDQWVDGVRAQKIIQSLSRWRQDGYMLREKSSHVIMTRAFEACGDVFSEQWSWVNQVAEDVMLAEYSWLKCQVKFNRLGCEFKNRDRKFSVRLINGEQNWRLAMWHMTLGSKAHQSLHLQLSKSLGICPDLEVPTPLLEQWVDRMMSGTMLTIKESVDEASFRPMMQWALIQHQNKAASEKAVGAFLKTQLLTEGSAIEGCFSIKFDELKGGWVFLAPLFELNTVLSQSDFSDQCVDLKTHIDQKTRLFRVSGEKKWQSFVQQHFPFASFKYAWNGLDLIVFDAGLDQPLTHDVLCSWSLQEQKRLCHKVRQYLSQYAPLILLKQSFLGYENQFDVIAEVFAMLGQPKVSGELLWYYQRNLTVADSPANFHIYDIHVEAMDPGCSLDYLTAMGFSLFRVKQGWCANHHMLKMRLILQDECPDHAQALGDLSQMAFEHGGVKKERLTDWDVIMQCRYAQLIKAEISVEQLGEWMGDWNRQQVILLCHRFADAYQVLPATLGAYLYQSSTLKLPDHRVGDFDEWLMKIKADLPEHQAADFARDLVQSLGYNELTRRF